MPDKIRIIPNVTSNEMRFKRFGWSKNVVRGIWPPVKQVSQNKCHSDMVVALLKSALNLSATSRAEIMATCLVSAGKASLEFPDH